MARVWLFKDGKITLVDKPGDSIKGTGSGSTKKPNALVWSENNEEITSFAALEAKLKLLGWESSSSGNHSEFLHFVMPSTSQRIMFPRDFDRFDYLLMEDIARKNRDAFYVRSRVM